MKRPHIRADCHNISRPCPYVSCRHHMIWFSPRLWWGYKTDEELLQWVFSLPYSCDLDFVENYPGGGFLEDIGCATNLTRERVRQLLDGVERKWGAVRKFKYHLHHTLSPEELQFVKEQ